jgi:TetR/AcrR family transcriptional repressor of nem operon
MITQMQNDILDTAQAMAQSRGFNGFSFRDLAAAVGIKPASIHYYFPTKGELGAALASRYTGRLVEILGDPSDGRLDALMARYIAVFRATLQDDGRMCLCGLMAAELDALPEAMQTEVARFVEANVSWVAAVLRAGTGLADGVEVRARARAIFAALEGAMLVARGSRDVAAFDAMVEVFTASGLIPNAKRVSEGQF